MRRSDPYMAQGYPTAPGYPSGGVQHGYPPAYGVRTALLHVYGSGFAFRLKNVHGAKSRLCCLFCWRSLLSCQVYTSAIGYATRKVSQGFHTFSTRFQESNHPLLPLLVGAAALASSHRLGMSYAIDTKDTRYTVPREQLSSRSRLPVAATTCGV